MEIKQIGSAEFTKMWVAACQNLKNKIEVLNSLNVFPVPDGDTGTNMYLTFKSAISKISTDDHHVGNIAVKISRGALLGARGNSGVILSQILRGISDALAEEDHIDAQLFATALSKGVVTSYKAVMRPVEGTILTVCKDSAKRAAEVVEAGEEDLIVLLGEVIKAAQASLNRTPELLPVLKQAGVVDAGGQGLVFIFEGWYSALSGKHIEIPEMPQTTPEQVSRPLAVDELEDYGYCTEFFIHADEQHVPAIIARFEKYGDSLVVVGSDDIIKIHIHSMHPGKVLEVALRYGEISRIKIENMKIQHTHYVEHELETKRAARKGLAVISVSTGDGLSEIFKSMGVDRVIKGGQTMNPSTEDLVKAIEAVNADNVIILPNNSNVILSALQCQDLVDSQVFVVQSKSIPQGFAALMGFDQDINKLDQTIETMIENMNYIHSGEITFATREFESRVGMIGEGDIIGINNGEITVIADDPREALLMMIDDVVDEESEVITVFVGEDVDTTSNDELLDTLVDLYPLCDIEVHYGGQPLYYYLLAIE